MIRLALTCDQCLAGTSVPVQQEAIHYAPRRYAQVLDIDHPSIPASWTWDAAEQKLRCWSCSESKRNSDDARRMMAGR